MKTNKDSYFLVFLFICTAINVGFAAPATPDSTINAEAPDFTSFLKALEAGDDIKAISIGDSILGQLELKYKADIGFNAYKSKLNAAEFLAEHMQQQLQKATNARLCAVADEVISINKSEVNRNPLSVAPAKRFYETSVQLFSTPVRVLNLASEAKTFLAQYYDLKLRILTNSIAKVGQALAIAEPSFKGTHDYVLVLPLLHASDIKSVNIDVLPQWMRSPEQLHVCSNSLLLHFGLPFHAMMVAEKSAQIQGKAFSKIDFYRSAAEKCGTSQPYIAADCLRKAMEYVPYNETDKTIVLQFETVHLWLDSKNYDLAADQAQKICETYPEHSQAGKAIWLYYYALSRNNKADEILVDIDKAIGDTRCEPYKAKLMYIKWWALRRKRDQITRVAASEQELLKQYGDNPIVSPVLLSRATDLLASQNYTTAYELLNRLIEKFPSTKAAGQARKMLVKLETFKKTN